MRVIVTGPRTWTDKWAAREALLKAYERLPDIHESITLVEGEAVGFDTIMRDLARQLGWEIDPFPIDTWYPNGIYDYAAGHKRNQRMVDSGAQFAFAGIMSCVKAMCNRPGIHCTHGTADCMARLKKASIEIVEVYPHG